MKADNCPTCGKFARRDFLESEYTSWERIDGLHCERCGFYADFEKHRKLLQYIKIPNIKINPRVEGRELLQ